MAAGTIRVTNGSKSVVGTGTTFTGVAAGSFLTFVLTGVAYTVAIDSVQSATALTLSVPFDGPTTSGVAFDITAVASMALATMGVTVQAQKALRMMIADQSNWRKIYGTDKTITVTLPDGTQFSGYSWGYISELLKDVDITNMEAIRDATITASNNAKTYATNSANSATAAATSNTAAQTAATAAKASQTAAATSATAAASSATAASGSASTASTQATNASNSAKAAAASQTAAKTSETNAKASQDAAASSASTASAQATAAGTSATNAKTSETNAKSSQTAAAASATAAAGSASTASTMAGTATTKAGEASTSATNAANSAASAKSDADRAQSANPDNLLKKANNLSDVANAATARANLKVPGLDDSRNTFTGDMIISQQNGLTVKPGPGQSNGWFASADVNGVVRYRLGIEANEGFSFYAYNSSGAGGRKALSYDYASNSFGIISTIASENYIRSSVGIEVDTYNDSTSSPAGSLVSRRRKADGTIIVASEHRANADGSVEWIKRDSANTPRGMQITSDNYVTFGGTTPAPNQMELGLKNSSGASYIDFHYDGTKGYDYSARVICDGMNSEQSGGGNLRLYAGFLQLNALGSTSIIGGRLAVNTSDAVFSTHAGFSGGSIQIPAAANSTAPTGAGLRGISAGADSADFNNASNINLYSWYGIGFCTAYTSPTNGVIQGKPAVFINTRTGTLNAKGAVQANGVTLTSDWNAKEEVEIIDPADALDKIGKLDGYTFRYKLSDSKRLTAGALAQDLDLVLPELVIKPEATPMLDEEGNVMLDEEGNPVNDGDSYLTADYMGLIGYLLAAVKGAKIKIEALEEKIAG